MGLKTHSEAVAAAIFDTYSYYGYRLVEKALFTCSLTQCPVLFSNTTDRE